MITKSQHVQNDIIRKKKGHVFIDPRNRNKVIVKRPHYKEFINAILPYVDVAIWTSMTSDNGSEALYKMFTPEEVHQNFQFLWYQEHCMKTIRYKYKDVFLKPLQKVYDIGLRTRYTPAQVLLVDDSPYKCCRNHHFTSLHPETFRGDIADRFLLDSLLPVIMQLSVARDVRLFVKHQEPKWSSDNMARDRAGELWQRLQRAGYIFKEPKPPPYCILHVSAYERTIDDMAMLVSLLDKPEDLSTLTSEEIEAFSSRLGYNPNDQLVPEGRIGFLKYIRARADRGHLSNSIPSTRECRGLNQALRRNPMAVDTTCTNKMCGKCSHVTYPVSYSKG